MGTILGYIVLGGSILISLILWCAADVPTIWREIAFNTRENKDSGDKYRTVGILAVVMQIFAVLVLALGILFFFMGQPITGRLF